MSSSRKPLQPFDWPKLAGVVNMDMMRRYATWLHQQIVKRWPEYHEPLLQPHVFTKSGGVCMMRHLRKFGDWAFAALQPVIQNVDLYNAGEENEFRVDRDIVSAKEKDPYAWPRLTGLVMVRDLKSLDWHIASMIRIKDEPEEVITERTTPDDPVIHIFGCTDPRATNYNPDATFDDGTCILPEVYGCTDPEANNYDPDATIDDGSCTSDIYGCTNPEANNYNPAATIDNGTCTFDVPGCTDPSANNYNPAATIDDGSCTYD